jgi:hypothetical protein
MECGHCRRSRHDFPAALGRSGEAVAALPGSLDYASRLQFSQPIVDPGLLAPGRHHELGDRQAARAGVGEYGQQPGQLRVAGRRLARRPAARGERSRVAVAVVRAGGRGRRVAARAGVGGGVAGGRLGGNGVQAGWGVGVVGGELVDLGGGGGGQIATGVDLLSLSC